MPKIDVNGARLGYDDTGTGTPLVLLHAGIADRRMWREQLLALADRHRVIVPDLRGYGESELPQTEFAHHDDVAALLAALDIPRAVLVGCSFGGAVAIDTALAHPERVAGLALFGTAVSGHEWSEETNDLWEELVGEVDPADLAANAAAEVRFWVVGPGRRPEQVDPGLLALAEEMDRRALAAELALSAVDLAELDPPAIGRLADLRVPVLVTAGAADVPEISRLADRIAAEAPYALRHPDVPDAGHLLPLERPEAVNRILLDFLTGIDRA
ncbi:alpha/beta fold hydrolase [Micromonospora yangpuensis]|uniref:Pimeloyl-ACP methyl ester carboxylesterase n=1 Tax=Micromonospora yangpuensis TaxID=683228 RepID=A0A1C6VCI3_9ACTN|nr:alpha/beta hydrolase [Micromonospora yangpuensis]GGM13103.1 hydrolase [Micromonospora yangpuensis]SCL64038.1 Pimeloyl-ACP methyl ester carboxylesterase [Micromonospora yangpuensis]